MQVVVAIGLSAMCFIGCSGTAGVRERAGELVVATHCEKRACASRPQPRHLGEGCYAVHDSDSDRNHLYDCSTDLLPAGAASCTDVTPCTGACKVTITVDCREIPIDRCLARWNADREAHRPPRTCSAARLQVVIEPSAMAAVMSSTLLALPAELVIEVIRSGKTRVVYTAEACVTSGGIVVNEPTHRTGFAKLDLVLHRKIGELVGRASPGTCAAVTLLVSHFECETDQALM